MNISGDLFLTIIQFVFVLGLLIFFHELGHFVVARFFKIEIEEFGFGFPPRMVRLFTWKGTEFTLNWIPFGAFVRPKGENDANVKGGLANANPWVRLLVLLGGPLTNVLVGVILFSATFMRLGVPNQEIVQVVEVVAGSPAEQVGLLAGDVILQINAQPVDSTTRLHNMVQSNLGQEITIMLERNDNTQEIRVIPRANPPEGQGPLGIVMGHPYESINIVQAIPAATLTAGEQARQFMLMPVRLLSGQADPDEARVVGPKGIFDIYQEVRRRDSQASESPVDQAGVNVLWFMGTISIALGLTNLLPIPALDGGRILFVLPELLLKRRIPQQYENLVHLIGFAALLLLMGYITIQDFANPIFQP
jgi:regulator of sigma E protease